MKKITSGVKIYSAKLLSEKRYKEFFELFFKVCDCSDYELEIFTKSGVNMFICIDKENPIKSFGEYVGDFNINEVIDEHRLSERYRKDFTVQESLDDFKDYFNYINAIKTIIYFT